MPQVHAQVTLVRSTSQPDLLVAAAGKLCYAADTAEILQQEPDKAAAFIRKLIKMGHMSLMEHSVFTFYIEGVSRAMTHQLVRHRLASYSQRSQRYVSHSDFDYIIPPQFEGKTVVVDGRPVDAVDYFKQTMDLLSQRYAVLKDSLGGKGEKCNEDARYVLPNACETKIFVTMNARELLHFFNERLCRRAQWEIRGVAEQMLALAKTACPAVFTIAGPKCVDLGHCPEGSLSCGQFRQIKQQYAPVEE